LNGLARFHYAAAPALLKLHAVLTYAVPFPSLRYKALDLGCQPQHLNLVRGTLALGAHDQLVELGARHHLAAVVGGNSQVPNIIPQPLPIHFPRCSMQAT
jgi:hypothetical protein